MAKIIEADDADPCIFTRDLDAPFKITRKYAGIMAARGFGQNGRGGWMEPSRKAPGARHPHHFAKTSDFSRDILDFWKGSKIEVTQCYLIELKALSDIIV